MQRDSVFTASAPETGSDPGAQFIPPDSNDRPVETAPTVSATSPHEVIDLTELSSGESSSGSEDEDVEEERDDEEDEKQSSSSDIAEIRNPAISVATRQQLHTAIATVSAPRLRAVVARLATEVPSAERLLIRALVAVEQTTREVVPRWETCGNCGEEYDLQETHHNDECVYHPGELEVQEDRFEDWDEDCHGPMDTRENRASYPENFAWSCCDADGDVQGCEQSEHVPEGPRKRRRLMQ